MALTCAVDTQVHLRSTDEIDMDTSPGKLRLDIPVVLPHVRDAADACIERLQSELLARPGVDRVHIRPAEGEGPGQLCVHFDPQVMSLARIRELA